MSKRLFLLSLFFISVIFCFFPLHQVKAQAQRISEEAPVILSSDMAEIGQSSGLPTSDLFDIVIRLIKLISQALGALLFLQFFYAGLVWMFAGGDDEKVGQAKKILWQSIIGVALMLTSYNIALFILGSLEKAFSPIPTHLL